MHSLDPRLSGYPNTNSIRCSSTGCSEIARRILESARVLRYTGRSMKHEYREEEILYPNYQNYLLDRRNEILLFPNFFESRSLPLSSIGRCVLLAKRQQGSRNVWSVRSSIDVDALRDLSSEHRLQEYRDNGKSFADDIAVTCRLIALRFPRLPGH